MLVQNPPNPKFLEFLPANTAFWASVASNEPASDTYVVVDLLHNNATVLLTNLHIAAYLSRLFNSKLAGIVAPTFTSHMVPMEEVVALAQSFGAEKIFRLSAPTPVKQAIGNQTPANKLSLSRWFARPFSAFSARRFSKLQGDDLRTSVLSLRMAGIKVGDLIYDTYVNWTGRPSIDTFDDDLNQAIAQAERYISEAHHVFSSNHIRATVLSASVYVDYGILLRLSLRHGAPVYCKAWLDPITIKEYRNISEATQFPDSPIEPGIAYFRQVLGAQFISDASQFFPPRPSTVDTLSDLRFGYGSNKSEMDPQALRGVLGVDGLKSTCLVLSHHFRDCPHCYPDALFDDYYQWLSSVLEFASRNPQVTWLVRQHPYELLLGETTSFNELTSAFRDYAHIKIIPDGITTSSFFALVDAVTTVAGSSGIEFASAGIPPILAGNPFYGDLSFAIRPRTRGEYFDKLAAIPTLPRLSDRQVQDAKEAALVHLSLKRIRCDRIPFAHDLADQEVTPNTIGAYWEKAANLAATPIEADALFANLKKMVAGQHGTMMNFSITDVSVRNQ
jgi:hypothetical protein